MSAEIKSAVPDDADRDALLEDGSNFEVDDDGNITTTWAFWEPQIEAIHAVYSDDYDIIGFVGGYRSGKSVTGARLSIEIALNPAFAPARILAMGKTFAEAKKTTYSVLFDELPGSNLDPYLHAGNPENSPFITNFNKQDGVLSWFNGSSIILASADKPDRYEGGTFSFGWLDEIAHYPSIHGVRKTVGERLDFGPPGNQIWTTTGNGLNDAYDVLKRRVDADENDLGETVFLTTASTENNPFLSDDDRARIRRVHGGSRNEKQALHGAFEAAEGLVYDNFRRQTHVVHPDAVDLREDFRMYGYDHGWEDPRVVLEIGKSDYGQFVVVDEFYESQSHIEDVIDTSGTYWLRDKPHGPVYCEHEPAHIVKFRRAGWKAGKAKKDIDAGIDDVRYRLDTHRDPENRPGLLVTKRCPNLISEFLGYTEDDVGGSDVDDHALDALRYAIHTHFARTGVGSADPTDVQTA